MGRRRRRHIKQSLPGRLLATADKTESAGQGGRESLEQVTKPGPVGPAAVPEAGPVPAGTGVPAGVKHAAEEQPGPVQGEGQTA